MKGKLLIGVIGLFGFSIVLLVASIVATLNGNVTGGGLITGNSVLGWIGGLFIDADEGGRGILEEEQGARVLFSPGDVSIAIVNDALNISAKDRSWGQPFISYYDGADAPAGAFNCYFYAYNYSISAMIKLPEIIQPGNYYLFVSGINYDSDMKVVARLGGPESPAIITNDRDTMTKYWSTQIPIQVSQANDMLNVTFIRSDTNEYSKNITNEIKFMLTGIYLTSNPDEIVLRTDSILDQSQSMEIDNSPPVKGNILSNSDFEVGVGHGWNFPENKREAISSIWDNTTSYHGNASFKFKLYNYSEKLENPVGLYSRVYSLKPNKLYTFSVWAKIEFPPGYTQNTYIALYVSNSQLNATSGNPYSFYGGDYVAPGVWTRLNVTGYALNNPSSDYIAEIQFGTTYSNGTVWIDAVQLEEGNITDYESIPVEVGFVTHKPGNVYIENESLKADLMIYNSESTQKNVNVSYEFYGLWNQKIGSGRLEASVPASSTITQEVDLPVMRGAFRAVVWVEGQADGEEEVYYSIVPVPKDWGLNTSSSMGVHPNFNNWELPELQRLGIKWARVLSPSAFFRWIEVESQDDNFTLRSNGMRGWYDYETGLADDYGISIMGTIGTNNAWPCWADNDSIVKADPSCGASGHPARTTPNLDEWEEFVGQIVDHYKGDVKCWEIWNEPDQVDEWNAEFYAHMLKRAVDAIEANDSDARIIGMGGTSLAFMELVVKNLTYHYPSWDIDEHIDVFSTHLYSSPESYKGKYYEIISYNITSLLGIPVWNTETGAVDSGQYYGENSNFLVPGRAIIPMTDALRYYWGSGYGPPMLVQNYIYSVGNNISKYFYYDSRSMVSSSYYRDYSKFNHFTFLEYDDTIRPKGIAYAVAGHFIDYSKNYGNAIPYEELPCTDCRFYNMSAFIFEREGNLTLVLFAKDYLLYNFTLNGISSSFDLYDIMGNNISHQGSSILFSSSPVYAVFKGLTVQELWDGVTNGEMKQALDRDAPGLSIVEAPRGPILEFSPLRVRWIGIDKVSQPSADNGFNNNPNSILYSYRIVEQGTGWSSWSGEIYENYPEGLPNGTYTFEILAKDESGNEVNTSRVITVGDGISYTSCWDEICSNGETCSSCSRDCGTCPIDGDDDGGGGGGGGGGSGGGSIQNGTNQTGITQNNNITNGKTDGGGDVTNGGEGKEVPGKIGSTGAIVFWGAIIVLIGGIVIVGYALIRKIRFSKHNTV